MSDPFVQGLTSLVLSGVAFSASGLGHLVMRGSGAGTRVRTVAAEYLIGVLLYSTLFAVAAHVQLPLRIVTALLGCLALASLWPALAPSLAGAGPSDGELRIRLAIAGLVAAAFFVASAIPVNPTALDPTTYAYMTSVLFHDDWAAANLTSLPDSDWLYGTAQDGVLSRVPALGVLWPAAALGLGLGARSTAAAAAWFLVPTFAALVDILHGRAPLLARVTLAAGAIGVFNEVAVLVDGQVNQTFAVAVMVTTVWGYRWIEEQHARALLLGLAGASVAAGYPEFLPAVPVYLVCCALQRTRSWPGLLVDAGAFAGGVLLVQLSTQMGNILYLLRQVDLAPEWWPLPNTPSNVAEVWSSVLLERTPPPLLALLLLPAAWFAWRSTGRVAPPPKLLSPRLVQALLATLIVSVGVWSWLALRSPNQNYATFKLGGWLGPGLFICVYLLAGYGAPLLRRPLGMLVLLLASTRLLGVAVDAPAKLLLYAESGPTAEAASWQIEAAGPADGSPRCVVRLRSDQTRAVMRALAESAAPTRGCHLRAPSAVESDLVP